MSAVARRYARAVVDAAGTDGGKKAVEELVSGLRNFAAALEESPALHELVTNPALRESRDEALGALAKKLGMGETGTTLVRLLGENRRLDTFNEVVREVVALADEGAGRLRAEVKSAIALSDDQKKRIAKSLEKRLGQPVVVEADIDPDLLGGLVCRVGDLTIDSSLRHGLSRLRAELEGGSH